MTYTVQQLAQLAGVSVRTLHYYDQIGLLKPAYSGDSGYRYYHKEQLLLLQQILFYKQLGIELKQIKQLLQKNDFNILASLHVHKKKLLENIEQMKLLVKTVDKTINHLERKTIMEEQELFWGFTKEQQETYEKHLVEKHGKQVEQHIEHSYKNIQQWDKKEWEQTKKEFDDICRQLARLLEADVPVDAAAVQAVIGTHYQWIQKFWTPNKESYSGLSKMYTTAEFAKTFEPYNKQLASYLAVAMELFAQNELN